MATIFVIAIFIFLTGCISSPSNDENNECIKTIVVVRHAEKILNDEKDPDLTEEGYQRAIRLQNHLRDWPVELFLSTNYKRCIKTIEPLASLKNMEIELYNADSLHQLVARIQNSDQCNFLISGHSNTNPQLINHLIEEEQFSEIPPMEYDGLYIVTLAGDNKKSVTVLRY